MWWESDTFNRVDQIPPEFAEFEGPEGIAVVRAYSNGKTDPGWGGEKFMQNYTTRMFKTYRAVTNMDVNKRPPFAFIMRSMRLVCIDIDGKNGGLEHVGRLGMLPYTLAETSKSDNGYHLFYSTEEEWDEAEGFAPFKDRIGIQQGVDLRVTGCVFHHTNQRWNHRPVAPLPDHLIEMLVTRQQKELATVSAIAMTLDTGDEEEIAIMQSTLVDDLAKPIPAGRRNNTLFAIGNQMKLAEVPDWQKLVRERAEAVGLDYDERVKLVANIEKYGPVS